jgi:hypothetical protein
MRYGGLLLAGLFCVALATGCGGASDKKNFYKDRDRPVPGEKAPADGPKEGAQVGREGRGRL